MDFGVFMFPTDVSIGILDLARAAEDHGFESLWVPEHTHIPTSRRSPWPGGPELPSEYKRALDPFVALGAAAAVTSRLKLGTGVSLVIEHDPIVLAKVAASVDFVSGGRLLLGIGGGWNYEEMEDHGTDPKQRWSILRERILAMKAIWTQDEAEFHGKHVNFDSMWSWPKPVQKPHPPILIGSNGPSALKRVVDYADGWMPIIGRGEIIGRMGELSRLAAEAGRAPIPVSIYGFRGADAHTVEEYRAAGASRFVFGLPSAPADEVLPRLKQFSEIARSFEPASITT